MQCSVHTPYCVNYIYCSWNSNMSKPTNTQICRRH